MGKWFLIGLVALVVTPIAIFLIKNLVGKTQDKLGFFKSAFLITIGIIIFNLISWKMIPWWWEILTYTWYTWMFANLGFWSILYLHTVKVKSADGKDTRESDPVSSRLANIITVILLVGLATTSWLYFQTGDLTQEEFASKKETEKTIRRLLIKEPVLAVVAKCQPKEFDTPKKLEEAIKLYADKGLLPWHSSMSCWESMITKDILPVRLAVVSVCDGSSEVVKNPHSVQDIQLTYRLINGSWKDCGIIVNGNLQNILGCKDGLSFPPSTVQFVGKKSFKVEIRIIQK
jgi:hypothetical protein